jgi:hypothetical protein
VGIEHIVGSITLSFSYINNMCYVSTGFIFTVQGGVAVCNMIQHRGVWADGMLSCCTSSAAHNNAVIHACISYIQHCVVLLCSVVVAACIHV